MKHLTAIVCLVMLAGALADFTFDSTSQGTEFVVGFGQNINSFPVMLDVTVSSLVGASVVITNQANAVLSSFTLAPNTANTVQVPTSYQSMSTGNSEAIGLLVTTSAPCSVYVLNNEEYTTDATIIYPVTALNTDYLVSTYSGIGLPDCFQVVATEDNTLVNVNVPVPVTINMATVGPGAGSFTLAHKLDSLSVCNSNPGSQVTGSHVSANKKVLVLGYDECDYVPNSQVACDILLEVMPPTSSLGLDAVVVPLATRTGGDIVRVLAAYDNTVVTVNGVTAATLNAGGYYDFTNPSTTYTYIVASQPAYFFQYATGAGSDGNSNADPMYMYLPGSQFWLSNYEVATIPGYDNWLSISVPTSQTGTITINGNPVTGWQPVYGGVFSAARVHVDVNTGGSYHVLSSNSTPFGLQVYGWAPYDAYGYAGGGGFVNTAPSMHDLQGGGSEGCCPSSTTNFPATTESASLSSTGNCVSMTFSA